MDEILSCMKCYLEVIYWSGSVYKLLTTKRDLPSCTNTESFTEYVFSLNDFSPISLQLTLQDLTWCNMLVNHLPNGFIYMPEFEKNPVRKQLRSEGRLSYAIFDFDLSLMLPSGKPLSEYRLPIHVCFSGALYKPWGVAEAQLDFNPFAYDVGCLGIRFCQRFQVLEQLLKR